MTGNPGKRPLNAHEPRPEPAAPDCPPELNPIARQEWVRLTAELTKLNLITHLDRGGGGDRANSEVWDHGEVADWLSNPVAVFVDSQQAS